jgi:ABC-2 type transport system permease protein
MIATRRFLRDTGLVFTRTAREAVGNAGLAFVAPTLLAVFLIVLFQGVYGKVADTAGWPTDQFIDWVAPGAVLLSVFVGAGYTAGGLLRDADSGYLDRIRLLPTNPATVLAGKVAFEAGRAVVPATGVLLIALALGADNRSGLPGALAVIAIAVALSVAWNGIFYLSALATRNHAAVLGLQPLFMPVVMFSTFWVPTSFMPGWYETVATWNPFTPILDAARSILLGRTDWGDLGVGLSLLTVLALVTYGLAGRHYATATSGVSRNGTPVIAGQIRRSRRPSSSN